MVTTPYFYTKLFVVIALEVSACLVVCITYLACLCTPTDDHEHEKTGVPSWCPVTRRIVCAVLNWPPVHRFAF